MTKLILCLTAAVSAIFYSCDKKTAVDSLKKLVAADKPIYIPKVIWNVPTNNDYNNDASLYSHNRKGETANFAAFWAKDFGTTPSSNIDPNKRFDLTLILPECERFYQYYTDTLQFVERGRSIADSFKTLIYITNSTDGTAYGGGAENKVGILWVTPPRINTQPFGAVAHELGHVFQYFVQSDGNWGYSSSPTGSNGQTIFEMTAQYMLWQVYPTWLAFENYHLQAFMKNTHYAFLHEINQYHSPFVLEYWSDKRGKNFIGKLWKGARRGEDPVATYKRMTQLSQQAFNDEIFDANRRFITWDMSRIQSVASQYANQHLSSLSAAGNGWYRIRPEVCPQNYGYNAIKLDVPAAGTNIRLQFKGIAGQSGYRSIKVDKAGWRYGFLAVKTDGSRVYGDVNRSSNGEARFTIPANTAFLWFVVSGAPTEHWEHLNDNNDSNDEQWPYEIKLEGTAINNSFIK
ncbi:DUF6055 domain-containing protein [Chitinophaga rhizophila]|uniref:Avirulence protein n=1 Tax=Chitinophaga rhizophila TaxID=2866212 RepID=A0ABS7GE60_9BACT|nr:DUF6055 domain-containing protein [Chitinophaga rhizophila]MBW8685942.1 hypothetical protein [Chitinophaga rhizophila]